MADLLEYLSDSLHCTYLSDLHFITVPSEQTHALMARLDGRFSLEDYQHALDYLSGGHTGQTDLTTARRTLEELLTAHK